MILKDKGVASFILRYTKLQSNHIYELKQRTKFLTYKTHVSLIFKIYKSLNTLQVQ